MGLIQQAARLPVGATSVVVPVVEWNQTGYDLRGYNDLTNRLYAISSTRIMKSDDEGSTWATLYNFTPSYPGSVLVLSTGTLLAGVQESGGNFTIYRSADGGASWAKVLDFGSNIVGFMRRGWCRTEQTPQRVFIGEYTAASEVTIPQTKLWRSEDDGATWTAVQTWTRGTGPGQIRHIHAVQWDPHGQKVWIATGDSDSQTFIYTTVDGTALTTVGSGDYRKYNTCSFAFDKWYAYWGPDYAGNPLHLWRYSRATAEAEPILELPTFAYWILMDPSDRLWVFTLVPQNNVAQSKYPANVVEIYSSVDRINYYKVAQFARNPSYDQYDSSIGPGYFTTSGKLVCAAAYVVIGGTTYSVGTVRFGVKTAQQAVLYN